MALFECNIKSDYLELNVSVNVIIPQDVKKRRKTSSSLSFTWISWKS